jgi:hypothetical protein
VQDELLVAYQIAFDLVHNASQQFRGEVRKAIGSGVEADAEQARIQEYYNEMVKKKEEKGASASSSGSDPMQEERATSSRYVCSNCATRLSLARVISVWLIVLPSSAIEHTARLPRGQHEGHPLGHHLDQPLP